MKRHLGTIAALLVLLGCGGSNDRPTNVAAGAGAGGSPAGAGAGASGSAAGAGASGSGGAGAKAVAGASGTSSSTAGSTSSDAIAPTFETVKLTIGGGGNIMTCAAAPCHGVNGMAPPGRPLELPTNDDQKLYTNLTSYVSKACGDLKLVEPGNPSKSALVKILSGPCGMTPRMPYGCSTAAGDCIPDEYIAAVTQWIANGAPR